MPVYAQPSKYITSLMGWGMAQVVDHLPSKCEALNSNPSTTKKKKKATSLIPIAILEILFSFCR
jgi:hypothetical protein